MLLLSTSLGYRRKQDPVVRLQVWHSKHTEQQSSHKKHELNKKRCYLCATDVLCHLMTVLVLLSVLGSVFLTSVTMCWSCLSTNVLHCKYKVIFLSGENKAGFPNCILIKAKQQQKQPQPTNQPTNHTNNSKKATSTSENLMYAVVKNKRHPERTQLQNEDKAYSENIVKWRLGRGFCPWKHSVEVGWIANESHGFLGKKPNFQMWWIVTWKPSYLLGCLGRATSTQVTPNLTNYYWEVLQYELPRRMAFLKCWNQR